MEKNYTEEFKHDVLEKFLSIFGDFEEFSLFFVIYRKYLQNFYKNTRTICGIVFSGDDHSWVGRR